VVRLARTHRPSRVAQALRINYTALKRRVLADLSATSAGGGKPEFAGDARG
jgi:hypothetical protein